MSKISIEEVEATLLRQKIDPKVVVSVVKELTDVIQEEKDNKVEVPKQKNEFLFVLNDPADEFKGKDLTGWVVQMKQGDDAGQVLGKIKDAALDTNEAKKRKKGLLTNFADAFYGVKRIFLKPKNILIKTKEPVRVLITNGKFQ